jgi:hypothetical protein
MRTCDRVVLNCLSRRVKSKFSEMMDRLARELKVYSSCISNYDGFMLNNIEFI